MWVDLDLTAYNAGRFGWVGNVGKVGNVYIWLKYNFLSFNYNIFLFQYIYIQIYIHVHIFTSRELYLKL